MMYSITLALSHNSEFWLLPRFPKSSWHTRCFRLAADSHSLRIFSTSRKQIEDSNLFGQFQNTNFLAPAAKDFLLPVRASDAAPCFCLLIMPRSMWWAGNLILLLTQDRPHCKPWRITFNWGHLGLNWIWPPPPNKINRGCWFDPNGRPLGHACRVGRINTV